MTRDELDEIDIDKIINANMTVTDPLLRDAIRGVVVAAIDEAVAAEREACAKACDEKVAAEYATGKVDHNEMAWTRFCAIVIRARGESKCPTE